MRAAPPYKQHRLSRNESRKATKASHSKETWERKQNPRKKQNPIKNKRTPRTGMVRLRGHSRPDDSPEFFKVFLPYTSSHQMVISLPLSLSRYYFFSNGRWVYMRLCYSVTFVFVLDQKGKRLGLSFWDH
jgi:hypothetical protein